MEIGVEITNFEEVKKWNFDETIRNAFFQETIFFNFSKTLGGFRKSEKVKKWNRNHSIIMDFFACGSAGDCNLIDVIQQES